MTAIGYAALAVGWLTVCASGPYPVLIVCALVAVYAGTRPERDDA